MVGRRQRQPRIGARRRGRAGRAAVSAAAVALDDVSGARRHGRRPPLPPTQLPRPSPRPSPPSSSPRRRARPPAVLVAVRATLDVVPAAFALLGAARDGLASRLRARRAARDALLAALAAAAAAGAAASLWLNAAIAAKVEAVVGAPGPAGVSRASAAVADADLASLPPPVARYLRYALPRGSRLLTRVRLRQVGVFRFRIQTGLRAGEGWKKVAAVQHAAALPLRPPGYVWAATVWLAPGLWVRGWDAYAGGRGHMFWRVLSALPLISSAAPEIDQSALLRYLTEAVYYPTALLPSPGLSWTPVGEHAARATLTAGPGSPTVAAVFHFGPGGEALCAKTEDRARPLEDGSVVSDAHTVEYSRWATDPATGIRYPSRLTMTWDLLRPFPYGKLDVVEYSAWEA